MSTGHLRASKASRSKSIGRSSVVGGMWLLACAQPAHVGLATGPAAPQVVVAGSHPSANKPAASTPFVVSSKVTQPSEWRVLFDGSSLSAWKKYNGDEVPGKWTVEESTLHLDQSRRSRGDIITREQFADFELELEWKIAPCGNSGIFLRVAEGDYRWPYETGPEMQVLDNSCHPDARAGLNRTAGSCYGLYPPTADVTRPAGEWNQVRIVAQGSLVKFWLNAELVVAFDLASEDFHSRVENSKFREWPDFATRPRGHVGLQDHGNDVWYRNIRIREL